jgi:hypothetical protein
MHEAYPENKDTKVLNTYIFTLQMQRCDWIACAQLYFSS